MQYDEVADSGRAGLEESVNEGATEMKDAGQGSKQTCSERLVESEVCACKF